jgi:RNA polymerase sigma factor (TIGR02999 family)
LTTPSPIDLTRLLQEMDEGRPHAADQLLPLVYEELRRLAGHQMAKESSNHTLQPTALVHEAYLRLVGKGDQGWVNRKHFFAAAAESMRRILVESARRKQRLRHGGHLERVELVGIDVAVEADEDQILLIHESIQRLEQEDPESAELIKLRFFVGLTNAQAARVLNLSERTAKRNWSYARAWLYRDMTRHQG